MRRAFFVSTLASFGAGAVLLGACGGSSNDTSASTSSSSSASSSSTGGAGGSGGMGGMSSSSTGGAAPHHPVTIFIDVDDHGLKALWDSNSPTLQMMAKEGSLAYSRVDIPTHSNQSNITLLTGGWPEVTNVPHNSWLDRADKFMQPFTLGPISTGDYIYYDKNPLGARVESIWSAAKEGGDTSTFVGLLPPWEHGADEVHFTINGSSLAGFTISPTLAKGIFKSLHYPDSVVNSFLLDGPPADPKEPLNQYTLEDAGAAFATAAATKKGPPDLMFVWDFIALDGNPTDQGADTQPVKTIVEAIDKGVASLMKSVESAGWKSDVSYVLTLDHGKVDTHNQVAFEKQIHDLVQSQGAAHGVTTAQVASLDEDGDALVYAVTDKAGTPDGAAAQLAVTHGLLELIQSGMIEGLDTTRTLSWDGYLGTKRFYDVRSTGPNNPDIIVFPQADWTLNDVNMSDAPGPITNTMELPYGRHGGFSTDELYVPAIFYGPAFKSGVMLPVPVDHPDIAPTVLASLGKDPPKTAQGGVIHAVLKNDASAASETTTLPSDPDTSRDEVLTNAGYEGNAPTLKGAAALGAILIDVSGLYEDDFPPGSNVQALVTAGTRFVAMHTRFRDWPTTEYQMLTGSYPVSTTWVPFAEDDPAQQVPPGLGLFAMPPAKNYIADQAGYDAWHTGTQVFTEQTLFTPAKALGLTTAVLGTVDFHLQHVDTTDIDVKPTDGKMLSDVLGMNGGKAFVLMAVDGGSDPKKAADDSLSLVSSALATAGLTGEYVVALTSRGGAKIDDASPDAHGPGSARHVPLVIAGPNIRAGAIVGGPATPNDLGPTLLFALGATARAPDLAFGVQLDGGMSMNGVALPLPNNNNTGKVLLQAFEK